MPTTTPVSTTVPPVMATQSPQSGSTGYGGGGTNSKRAV
jgi:hypothetical protein